MSYISSKKYGTAVQLYKKTNGDIAYYITYKDEFNKLKRLKIGDKSKGITESYCNQKRIEIINSIKLGEEPPALAKKKKAKKMIILDDLAKLYLESLKVHSSKNTIQSFTSRYYKHLSPTLGKKEITSITSKDIEDLKKAKLEVLALETINHLIVLFGSIFNFGVKEELYSCSNPALKVKRFKSDTTRERYLNKDEITILLENVEDNELLNIFTRLALSTGARRETILSIQLKDLNLEDRVINLQDFKNSSSYKGFISDSLLKYLKEHTKDLTANSYIVGKKLVKYQAKSMHKKMKPIFDSLFNEGLDEKDSKNRVVIHTLRHTFASHLAINGTPIFTIQKLMNHKDIAMTMRYAKLAPDSGKEFVNGLYR
jgi:integrase